MCVFLSPMTLKTFRPLNQLLIRTFSPSFAALITSSFAVSLKAQKGTKTYQPEWHLISVSGDKRCKITPIKAVLDCSLPQRWLDRQKKNSIKVTSSRLCNSLNDFHRWGVELASVLVSDCSDIKNLQFSSNTPKFASIQLEPKGKHHVITHQRNSDLAMPLNLNSINRRLFDILLIFLIFADLSQHFMMLLPLEIAYPWCNWKFYSSELFSKRC